MKSNKQGKNKTPNATRKVQVRLNPGLADDHITSECYHKLNRIIDVSNLIRFSLLKSKLLMSRNREVSQLLSYFNDDVKAILSELKSKGLCDGWLNDPIDE
ncbi:hypothetical protein [Serratia marcescens]|uniref:hypothetical protein n=1 Tax=Serratia marcescens TaxID=615 RepID=UPI0013DCEA5E|nr:hypothetical protein [Serratia marcescens]